jgi:hypothetical protein
MKILKSGTNKGNRRVWIEGRWLLDHGFACGQKFYLIFSESDSQQYLYLSFVDSDYTESKRLHKIAGTALRPIIDLNGKYLNDLFGNNTHFGIQKITSGEYIHIKITPLTRGE